MGPVERQLSVPEHCAAGTMVRKWGCHRTVAGTCAGEFVETRRSQSCEIELDGVKAVPAAPIGSSLVSRP
jgi:hypothetical protein